MFIQVVDKQRRGVRVVKTALLSIGITDRSVCVQADSWAFPHGDNEQYSVFVSAPNGANEEPFYETGKTITEAVKKALDSIKGRAGGAKREVSEVAPF
jgi:hypothetical protein